VEGRPQVTLRQINLCCGSAPPSLLQVEEVGVPQVLFKDLHICITSLRICTYALTLQIVHFALKFSAIVPTCRQSRTAATL
jgi:hypothetical protein